MNRRLILASASPRRAQLLSRICPKFEIVPSRSPEHARSRDPEKLVRILARDKAREVAKRFPEDVVLGADTIVWREGVRYGKPKDAADAEKILRELSGREHLVLTGVCLVGAGREITDFAESRVRFRTLDEDFIRSYVASGIPMDKAGGYGIQCSPSPVESWSGDYDNIVGLPVGMVEWMLQLF